MKRAAYLLAIVLTAGVCLSGCHRDYKVIHVRPAEDTTIQVTPEPVEEKNPMDEPLLEIPDPPQEEDFTNVSSAARKEYEDYIKGR